MGIWLIGFGIFQLVHYCIYGEYKKCDDDKEDDTRNDRARVKCFTASRAQNLRGGKWPVPLAAASKRATRKKS